MESSSQYSCEQLHADVCNAGVCGAEEMKMVLLSGVDNEAALNASRVYDTAESYLDRLKKFDEDFEELRLRCERVLTT